MRIVSVQNGFERDFWTLVNQDPFDYYFFTFDYKYRKDEAKIFLALENSQTKGAMLVYADRIVQLRGSREAVQSLLNTVKLENAELQAPVDCEEILLKKYRPKLQHVIVLMTLMKGGEKIQINRAPTMLSFEDAEEVAEVLRKADPEFWGNISSPAGRHWEDAYMLGIRNENTLVSVGMTRFADFGSNISVIATIEEYRNMGFATSIVSALVQEILKHSTTALIHVRQDNAPAVRTYTKVGFKPYKQYLLMRGELIDKYRARQIVR